jgi:predicted DCC family thiol-disulfide oxidoreductase YuxK
MDTKLITVIYDGQCRFCIVSLFWLQKRLQVNALAFQGADLATYGLTYGQCSKEVFALNDNQTYAGAEAVAFLLRRRGNIVVSKIIKRSGIFGRFGYRWIASHRNSLLARLMMVALERS